MRDGEAIINKLGGKPTNTGWMFRCPCHNDSTPSCSLRDKDGLVTCFAGCPRDQVEQALDAMGFTDDGTRREYDPIQEWQDRQGRIRHAQELWKDSEFSVEGVQYYLVQR